MDWEIRNGLGRGQDHEFGSSQSHIGLQLKRARCCRSGWSDVVARKAARIVHLQGQPGDSHLQNQKCPTFSRMAGEAPLYRQCGGGLGAVGD
jgi:hypothetical protein